MDLNHVGKNWKKECRDIKNRPKLYLLKISALLFFAVSYYLIVSPFLCSVENYIQKWGYIGMIFIIGSICLKKVVPQTALSFCNGEIICQIDNVEDIKKINCFYVIVLACSFLFTLFVRQIKDSFDFFYGNRANNSQ